MGALAEAVSLELRSAAGQSRLPAGHFDLADYLMSAGAKINEDGASWLLRVFADRGYIPGIKCAQAVALARQMGRPEAASLLEKHLR